MDTETIRQWFHSTKGPTRTTVSLHIRKRNTWVRFGAAQIAKSGNATNIPDLLVKITPTVHALKKYKRCQSPTSNKKHHSRSRVHWPSILPIELHWDQAVLASNCLGRSRELWWDFIGISSKAFRGIFFTPRIYLNWPTYKKIRKKPPSMRQHRLKPHAR